MLQPFTMPLSLGMLAREHSEDGVEIETRLVDGRWAKFPAWRSRCDLPGRPSIGTVRFATAVASDADGFLARSAALQCAAFHLPYGGACGGIAEVPDTLSPADLDRICAAFCRAFPDMALTSHGGERAGGGTVLSGWLTGERHALRWSSPGAWYQAADPVREDAVALGAVDALRHFHPRPGTWALDGWDRASLILARLMTAAGWRLVAAADGHAAVANGLGLSASEIACAMAGDGGMAALASERGSRRIDSVWQAGADVVVVAGRGLCHLRAAAEADGGITVVELVPGAVSVEAETRLIAGGSRVIPEIVAGGGAPILAHLRYLQRRHRRDWSAAALRSRLLQRFSEGLMAIVGRGGDLRAAAITMAQDFTEGLRNGAPVHPL